MTIDIVGLRDARGVVRLCLTRNPKDFPDCKGPDAVHATVKATTTLVRYTFQSVHPGTYALGTFHDANANGKLDTMMGMPKEGFAFSRNPPMKPRAPRFNEASFQGNGPPLLPLKMKYVL